MTTPLLELDDIVMHFPARAGAFGNRGDAVVHAVDGVSLTVQPNETVALVGESGCGKSTTARVALGLLEPTAGTVRIDGQDLAQVSRRDLKQLRQRAQIVFQDPFASLDPRMRVSSIVAEPLRAQGQGSEARTRVPELLGLVGLSAEHAGRYPHEFSGGQRQRIGIARALALAPDLLVLDEPVSALDVSIRAQVLNLLTGLQDQLSLAYLFISHDLAVVRHIANRVAVMYLGKIVEFGPARDVYADAGHPYTRALLSAVPEPDPARERVRQRIVLRGDLPSAIDPPSGCRFRTRCWKAQDLCAQEEPALVDRGHGHPVACHFPE
ncbi:MAG: ATP-binding cassette domain-containing protein [Actinobacteria bacterium]|nr:MAG: ATP-binding cassette domain-containing protein [Actinomycetota bacterium]